MSELAELYQELILDHNARPRNFGAMAKPSHKAEGINPLCGDHVVVYLQLEGDKIALVQFDGKGCAISKASASMMTQRLRGKTLAEAESIFGHFHEMVTEQDDDDEGRAVVRSAADGEARTLALGKLEALAGVRGFPMRIKCATLAWHTFHAALAGKQTQVSTEDAGNLDVPEAISHKDAP